VAAPVVEQVVESSTNTAGTSHTVTLPTATAGQLLLVLLDKGSVSATINAHASLTELLDEASANGLYIAYRWMDGSEPSTYTLTSSANTRSAVLAYRISGAANPASVAPQIGTTATGTSATPDPPASATPPSSKDYLFIAFAGMAGEEADDDTWGNTPPTNYTPSPPRQKACGTAGTNLGGLILAAERALTTGSAENPGAFGVDVSAAWRAQTVTVHPDLNVTVTPTTLALTTTPNAPTVAVSDHQLVTPTTASLTLSAFAPTVTASDHQSVTPGVAALTIATFAPTVTVAAAGVSVIPTTAALTTTAFAPTVTASDHKTLIPTTATLTTTQFAPTVTASNHQLVTPTTASLATSAFAPTVTATDHKTLVPSPASLTLTTYIPNIGNGVTVVVSAASLSLSTFAPTVAATQNRLITPDSATLAMALFAPSVYTPQTFTPTTASLLLTTFAPTVGSAALSITGGLAPTATASSPVPSASGLGPTPLSRPSSNVPSATASSLKPE
jgi:hypothetical protein